MVEQLLPNTNEMLQYILALQNLNLNTAVAFRQRALRIIFAMPAGAGRPHAWMDITHTHPFVLRLL
jgi:hypothetical protein